MSSRSARIARELAWRAAGRRYCPKLHDTLIILHQESDSRTVGRASQPMARTLYAGELALGCESEPALHDPLWRARHPRCRAGQRTVAGDRYIIGQIHNENFGKRSLVLREDIPLKGQRPSLPAPVRADV